MLKKKIKYQPNTGKQNFFVLFWQNHFAWVIFSGVNYLTEKQTESYVVMMQKRRGLLRNITQPSMFAVFLVVTKVFDI